MAILNTGYRRLFRRGGSPDPRTAFPIQAEYDDAPDEDVTFEVVQPLRKAERHYFYRYTCCCIVCGQAVPAARRSRQTCSDVCRARLRRSRNKIREIHEAALFAVGDLQRIIDGMDPVAAEKARAALADLAEQVSAARRESLC